MSASLYVAKADGDREMLDDVTPEMARQVFAGVDWDAELAAVKAAQDTGKDVFMPEFGLNDDAERTLCISPVDATTISFYIQFADHLAGLQSYAKSEANRLIELYFGGETDEFTALIAAGAKRVVETRALSDSEFENTIVRPMLRLGDAETYRPVPVHDYLAACIDQCNVPATLDALVLESIYLAADKRHSHLLFNYGSENTWLAIVTAHDPENEHDELLGHYFLSMSAKCYTT